MKSIAPANAMHQRMSLPVRGAWIEIPCPRTVRTARPSLPVRGAWIEIESAAGREPCRVCRSPCGERGLKCPRRRTWANDACRSPCGERGLKFFDCFPVGGFLLSLPVRGAWIEICGSRPRTYGCPSLPVRGAWIEIRQIFAARSRAYCRSPCGERGLKCGERTLETEWCDVAPRAGSVD